MKTIKLSSVLFTVTLIFGVISCKPPEPLSNTKWKLIGFVDDIADTIKIAEPESEKCYILEFNEDKTFFGVSSTNTLNGKYEIDYSAHNIKIIIISSTKINELFDGKLYVETLNMVQSFILHENELRLYYNDKKDYLLFKSQYL